MYPSFDTYNSTIGASQDQLTQSASMETAHFPVISLVFAVKDRAQYIPLYEVIVNTHTTLTYTDKSQQMADQ